jgi:small lipoprotein (TIGR04454 family)
VSEIPQQPSRLCAIVSIAATLACAPRPSSEQCEAMVEHVITLMRASHDGRAAEIAGAVAEERRAALLDQCLTEGSAAEVECVLGAEALEGIQDCAPRR